jgi:RimJ/RimL family protein N-acetyltransferase
MHTANIPVLETKRLILRGPEAEDYPDFKATFSSYRSRFMGGPLNAYEAWMLYAAEIGHWNIRGFGMWMIHDKETDETYGMAGGWKPALARAEIAWIIWPDKAGKGYALEATHAARDYYYKHQGWETAVSYLDPKNLDSIRLAERLGANVTMRLLQSTGLMRSTATHRPHARWHTTRSRHRHGDQPLR